MEVSDQRRERTWQVPWTSSQGTGRSACFVDPEEGKWTSRLLMLVISECNTCLSNTSLAVSLSLFGNAQAHMTFVVQSEFFTAPNSSWTNAQDPQTLVIAVNQSSRLTNRFSFCFSFPFPSGSNFAFCTICPPPLNAAPAPPPTFLSLSFDPPPPNFPFNPSTAPTMTC